MMVDCMMKDGRTTFRFSSRGAAIAALKRKPSMMDSEDSGRGIHCWRWFIENNEWQHVKLQYLNASSISFVLEVPRDQREAFLSEQSSGTKGDNDASS
jgi:hypothetical protein